MSDANRPRRPTKTANRAEPRDNKASREELARMLQRETPEMRPPPAVMRRSWEKFDDLPEQGQRRVPAARPSSSSFRPVQPAMRDDFEEAAPQPRYSPLAESRAALHEAELMHGSSWASLPQPPLYGEMRRKPWLMLLVALVSIVIIVMFMMPSRTTVGTFREPAPAGESVAAQPAAPAPAGEHSILRAPTLSAEQIDEVLREYNSPAAGTGKDWVELGQKYGIDPSYALAFFVVESTAGTAQGWAGWKPDGTSTHNIGNIICAGYETCYGRFRDYRSWQEGIEDWYRLISVEYVGGRGLQTIEQIIPIYAPAFENDVDSYVNNVERMVSEWRTK